MIRRGIQVIAILFFIPATVLAQELKLEDIWLNGKFSSQGVRGFTALNDGESYVQLDVDKERNLMELNRYSIRDGSRLETLVSNGDLNDVSGERLNFGTFELSKDEKRVLFLTDIEHIYRHSFSARFHVFDREKGILYHSKESVRYATFSPDASKVAYVLDNNLMVLDLTTGDVKAVTNDGKTNAIINGAVDWVYEEEFSMARGFEWSPDGAFLAYYRFDESGVREYSMDIYGSLYPKEEVWKYPKAGESNSIVQVYIYELAAGSKVLCATGENNDIYLPRIKWTDQAATLSIQRLNRLQNHWEILFANAKTGITEVVYEEENKAYIDITDNLDFEDGSFIFTSERSGYNHIYQYDYTKKNLKAISTGNWDIDNYYGYDASSKKVYCSAANETAIRRNIFAIQVKNGKMSKLNEADGWNSAFFTKGFKYFLHTFSNASTPTVYTLRDAKGKSLRVLEENYMLKETLKTVKLGSMEFNTLTTDSGVTLNYSMIKPADFDPNKKYPVLMYVYGGPGSQTVRDTWGGAYYLWFNYLAQNGYIVVSVDNRGTGARGEDFKKCTYLQLGKFEIEDQIAAARVLGRLSYVDESRMGIWGWSFGGYMASLGITKGNDVFRCAVAVAPVTNWRYYDNIYTERFMRTPQENGASYDANSPINHVDRIRGHYLIIHGTADDNVHFQNTVEMVDAMIQKNVKYDSEFYPNKNHGIYGGTTRLHLFNRISDYLFIYL
ncbi:MAG: prolyl oligopeptidase family serine peptidase [Bacteroidetes bacterium]|nr:prolyl oligopeptidase family serine peptidase [Bacteroidota bacterium]